MIVILSHSTQCFIHHTPTAINCWFVSFAASRNCHLIGKKIYKSHENPNERADSLGFSKSMLSISANYQSLHKGEMYILHFNMYEKF